MAPKTLNLSRIARRRLRRRTPPGAGVAWARAANRLAAGANLAGIAAVTMLIAALFSHAVTGDCTAAHLAEAALDRASRLYEPFVIGWFIAHAPSTLGGFATLAARWTARADATRQGTEERWTTAAWLRDEPFLIALAAAVGLMMVIYGVSVLASEIRDQASWASGAPRHAAAAAACGTESDNH